MVDGTVSSVGDRWLWGCQSFVEFDHGHQDARYSKKKRKGVVGSYQDLERGRQNGLPKVTRTVKGHTSLVLLPANTKCHTAIGIGPRKRDGCSYPRFRLSLYKHIQSLV